ncbi:MAG TPA: hypothetical protein VGC39_06590, partial [Candidatus Methylacidiphilales bacterium]
FFSETGCYYPAGFTSATQESDVSLVGYKINKNYQLVRLSKGLVWNGVSPTVQAMIFNPLPTSITNNTITTNWPQVLPRNDLTGADLTDPDYQVIGDQIFRLEYCFLIQSSPFATKPTTTSSYFYDSPWTTPDTTPSGLKDVTAIVVSIAVLDTKSRVILNSTALKTAAATLGDTGFSGGNPTVASATVALPLASWKTKLATNGLGLPQAAASQVRFYQRYCYLNHLQ